MVLLGVSNDMFKPDVSGHFCTPGARRGSWCDEGQALGARPVCMRSFHHCPAI